MRFALTFICANYYSARRRSFRLFFWAVPTASKLFLSWCYLLISLRIIFLNVVFCRSGSLIMLELESTSDSFLVENFLERFFLTKQKRDFIEVKRSFKVLTAENNKKCILWSFLNVFQSLGLHLTIKGAALCNYSKDINAEQEFFKQERDLFGSKGAEPSEMQPGTYKYDFSHRLP